MKQGPPIGGGAKIPREPREKTFLYVLLFVETRKNIVSRGNSVPHNPFFSISHLIPPAQSDRPTADAVIPNPEGEEKGLLHTTFSHTTTTYTRRPTITRIRGQTDRRPKKKLHLFVINIAAEKKKCCREGCCCCCRQKQLFPPTVIILLPTILVHPPLTRN